MRRTLGSRKAGDGEREGAAPAGFPSDSDRGFGVLSTLVKRVVDRGVLSPSSCPTFCTSCSVKEDLVYVGRWWFESGAVEIVVDMAQIKLLLHG